MAAPIGLFMNRAAIPPIEIWCCGVRCALNAACRQAVWLFEMFERILDFAYFFKYCEVRGDSKVSPQTQQHSPVWGLFA